MSEMTLDLGADYEDEVDPGAHLAMKDADVARLTRPQREARLDHLIADSWRIYHEGIRRYVTGDNRILAGTVILFSGGNDSTVMAHMFREVADYAGHAHTGIGIEGTRQFVRDVCASWNLPLLERKAPREKDSYVALVLSKEVDEDGNPLGGFPGPGMHWKMWQRLKERAIEAMQAEVVAGRGRTHRVVMLAGRRRDESARRTTVPEFQVRRSRVWISPMVHWTKLDLTTYRLRHPEVPTNKASSLIHMSGECLCGSYASPGERDELEYWFNDDLDLIRWLEAELLKPEYDLIPAYRKTWGWSAIPELAAMATSAETTPKAAGLCGSCNPAFQSALFEVPEQRTTTRPGDVRGTDHTTETGDE